MSTRYTSFRKKCLRPPFRTSSFPYPPGNKFHSGWQNADIKGSPDTFSYSLRISDALYRSFSLFSPPHHRSLCGLRFIINHSQKGTEWFRTRFIERKKKIIVLVRWLFPRRLGFFYRRLFVSRDILRELEYDISKSRLSERGGEEKNTLLAINQPPRRYKLFAWREKEEAGLCPKLSLAGRADKRAKVGGKVLGGKARVTAACPRAPLCPN